MIAWNRVSLLRDEIGEDDFQEVVDLFLEEVDEVIARLEQAPDPATLPADLHFLKGSALNLGFERFALMCQRGEQSFRDAVAPPPDLAAILDCYRTSRADFLTGLQTTHRRAG